MPYWVTKWVIRSILLRRLRALQAALVAVAGRDGQAGENQIFYRIFDPQPSFFVRLGLNFEGKIPLNPS